MTLHLFNPEHDLALAAGTACFTAPHAGRQLRRDLAFIPAIWADAATDRIAVDDADAAQQAFARFAQSVARTTGGAVRLPRPGQLFVPVKQLFTPSMHRLMPEPWGWDAAIKAQLLRAGLPGRLLPGDDALDRIRQLSHRHTAAFVLGELRRIEGTVGEAMEAGSLCQVKQMLGQQAAVVVKAPWSSSGRGVRFIEGCMSATVEGWIARVLRTQGTVMVEPRYDKVKDFGMEFMAVADGTVSYQGLSLFHTANGAYTGNILATEAWKRRQLARYVSPELLDSVSDALCQILPSVLSGGYAGPLGVDMMIVRGGRLHPCVEINLRRTMGHVALALTRLINPAGDDDTVRIMRIACLEGRYKLKLTKSPT